MTQAQSDFITDILVEYSHQVEIERDYAFISKDQLMLRRYILILKRIYAKIIIDYFNVVSEDDVNFFTEEEIQLTIDRFNQLCNTDYTVDVTITDTVTGSSTVWDDTAVWSDSDIWTES